MDNEMDKIPQNARQNLRESLKNFLTAQSLKTKQQETCPRCGVAMRYVNMSLALDEADCGWNLRLPYCLCTDSSPSLSVAKRGVRYDDWT